jgi:hypothetical protein
VKVYADGKEMPKDVPIVCLDCGTLYDLFKKMPCYSSIGQTKEGEQFNRLN